ncbi:MAG: (Fe-S)-binding protein, partial [Planctomycetota bacterium]
MKNLELQNELERCAKCGQCRSVCPVFIALKDEKLVARGRLALIQAESNDSKNTYKNLAKIIDTCLMCRRCEENCPSLVNTEEIFKSQRLRMAKEKGLPLLLRFGFRYILPHRWLYNIVLRAAYLFHRFLNKQVTSFPVRHLPLYFANLLHRIPELAPKSALESIEHRANSKGNSTLHAPRSTPVSLFIGCAANYIYPEIINQITAILKHHKIPYTIPSQQVCCGFPALLSGDEQTAQKLMKINLKTFNTGTIITVCPTCNRMLKEMGNGEWGTGNKIVDAMEFLQSKLPEFRIPHSALRTIYHLPCHSTGTKVPEIIKSILKATTDYQETESDLCCGGGGL